MELVRKQTESLYHVKRKVLFVESMGAEEKYRGRGIAHLFFEKVKSIKESEFFDAIELRVNVWNNVAYEMYLKYGYKIKSFNMELI